MKNVTSAVTCNKVVPSESALRPSWMGFLEIKLKQLLYSVDIFSTVILIAGTYFEQTFCLEFKLVGNWLFRYIQRRLDLRSFSDISGHLRAFGEGSERGLLSRTIAVNRAYIQRRVLLLSFWGLFLNFSPNFKPIVIFGIRPRPSCVKSRQVLLPAEPIPWESFLRSASVTGVYKQTCRVYILGLVCEPSGKLVGLLRSFHWNRTCTEIFVKFCLLIVYIIGTKILK